MRRRLLRSVLRLNCMIFIILDHSVVQSSNRSCPLLMESPCTSFPLRNLHCLIWNSAGLFKKAALYTQRCVSRKSHSLDTTSSAAGIGGSDFMQLGRSKTTIKDMPQTSHLHAISYYSYQLRPWEYPKEKSVGTNQLTAQWLQLAVAKFI